MKYTLKVLKGIRTQERSELLPCIWEPGRQIEIGDKFEPFDIEAKAAASAKRFLEALKND
jgi:hypothetical protein